MPIILRLDRIMADRKMSLNELSEKVGISNVNMSRIKTGKIKAIRFSTLEMICETLDCQPGDILEYVPNGEGIFIDERSDISSEDAE
ncbi:helix-turn-helix domain-containing protein [Raoultibacter timonensis]|uniref:Transcriptional regulator n=1 Tax=Raoultibacter timonensis TaxID=1907662 RepID=A0ABM7WH13_9ACTN|nr:helix-turn-helix transcriptional regulator [Raoultibacter timonensis]BDE95539.1 transcriptional regulator [Raoultibacter timonensis]BDF50143.1 transcriptional regulator [Raoultibacter timonensis]